MNALLSMLPTFESALAVSLLQAAWSGTLLGLAGAAVLGAMARRSAAARHAVGFGFLVSMLVVPAWQCVVLLMSGATPTVGPNSVASAGTFALGPDALVAVAPLLPGDWLVGLWAIGVLAMLLRLAGGAWLLRGLARLPAAPLPVAWELRVDALRQALGIARPVAVRVLDAIAQPFTARLLRPVIWLPAVLLTRFDPAQLEALIAHELAHVRRLDWLWNGMQCAIEALLFFHPAVWLLGRRVRQERENACDDLAAALCGDTVVVAEALAALASLSAQRPLPRFALAAGGGALVQRVARLVGGVRSPVRLRWPTVAVVVASLLATGMLASRAGVVAPRAAGSAVSGIDADRWWTMVGDSIRLRVLEQGHVRDYHAWSDWQGTKHQTFRIDGALQVVDEEVRRWVAERRGVEPVLPPPVEAALALPPLPVLEQSPAHEALAEQIAADPASVARLGSPIRLKDDCGPCRIDRERASLTLTARGPQGASRLRAVGRLIDGQWHYERFELEPINPVADLFDLPR